MRINVIVCRNAIPRRRYSRAGAGCAGVGAPDAGGLHRGHRSIRSSGDRGCFAPDGVLEFTGGAEPLTGPDGIEAGLGTAVTRPSDSARRAPTHVRHHVSSNRFGSVASDQVEVTSYFAVHTDVGPDHWGRYRDVLETRAGNGCSRIAGSAWTDSALTA